MDVIWVATCGVAIVLVLILLLRLHPLLSLLIGALFVFAATPRSVLLTSELADREVEVVSFGGAGLIGINAVAAEPGQYYLSRELTTTETPQPLQLVAVDGQLLQAAALRGELSIAAKSWLSLGPDAPALKKGDKLVLVDAVRAVDAERWSSLGGKLAAGFGKTFIKLGVPVDHARGYSRKQGNVHAGSYSYDHGKSAPRQYQLRISAQPICGTIVPRRADIGGRCQRWYKYT